MKSIKFEIPEELLPYLGDDQQNKIKNLIVIGLYQERKLTLRQAADILDLNYKEMQKLLANKNIFFDFDENTY
jgi:predicted HTH domain antitoxin